MHRLSVIPGVIFGIIFAAGGFFMLLQTAWPTWQSWSAMQQWQPAQAQLTELSGGENYTRARYQYEVDGVGYQSDRVYVADMNDNIGSYHHDLLNSLRSYHVTQKPVSIWVNPQDPQQAVIDRDMRWGLFAFMSVFCAIFIVAGLVIAYASVRSGNATSEFKRPSLLDLRKEWKQKQQEPSFNDGFLEFTRNRVEELQQEAKGKSEKLDWQKRTGWEVSAIRSEAMAGLKVIWGFAIFWNLFSWTMTLLILPRELKNGNYAALAIILFVLIGAVLLYLALKPSLEYRRFGKVLFEMDPYPGAIGGHVGGHVHVPQLDYSVAVSPTAKLLVRLECVYSYMSGSGKDRKRSENIKWAEEGVPRIESSGKGVDLAFRFDVPDKLPEADVEQSDAYYFWRLTVKADIEGIDLNRHYNIPVFQTGEKSRFAHHDLSAKVAEQKRLQSEEIKNSIARGNFAIPGLSRAMKLSVQGNEINMVFPMFRNKVLIVFAAIFAGAFGFASFSMTGEAFERGAFGLLSILFALPFILVALLASIATVYLMFNNLRVDIRSDGVTVLRRLLFIPVVRHQLSKTDISYLSIKRTGSTGQGVDQVEHFKVQLYSKVRKKMITIAEDLDGKDVASHFCNYLAQRLNIESRTQG